jgi:glyoxylase-like metal-dependent hydrolase (beta-lactamase superfamily II)/predicted ester cyclase
MSGTTGSSTDSISPAVTAEIAKKYFDALIEHDVEAAVACWLPGGRENVRGQVDTTAPDGVRDFLNGIFTPFPDFAFEVLEVTVEEDRAAVRWKATGSFSGGSFQGIEPTGAKIELEGVDVLIVRDGLIVENNAYADGMTIARQLGLLPPDGSKADNGMKGAFNARTKLMGKLSAGAPEQIAEGVWVIRGGFPGKTMNVYLVRDGDGVMLFDAGVKSMAPALTIAAGQLGGITRVVLGHSHADHRGTAALLGAPVFCHPDEVADAEGDAGEHYFKIELLNPLGRKLMPKLLASWDAGPVKISGTLEEGDEIAGFKVIHLPGHAPGLIGLWRESDRFVLASDCFYTLDPQTGMKGHTRVPHSAFNLDTEMARASIRKLAALEPATAWAGHTDPLTGDVRAQLEHAAATT